MHEKQNSIRIGENGQGKKEVSHSSRAEASITTNEARTALAVARPGYIYLIRLGRLVKIGRTTTPNSRLRDMLTILPTARLLYLMRVPDMGIERELHLKYSEKRAHGEWFDLDYRDVKSIKQIAPEVTMDHIPMRTPHEKRMDVFRAKIRRGESKKYFATISISCRGKSQRFRVIRFDERRFIALGKVQAASSIGKRIALALEAML